MQHPSGASNQFQETGDEIVRASDPVVYTVPANA
jgi:hypothetical protein